MVYRKTISTSQFILLASLNGVILIDDLIEAMNNVLDGNIAAGAYDVVTKIIGAMPHLWLQFIAMLDRISGFVA